MSAGKSPYDSARFGFPIFRATCNTVDEVRTSADLARKDGGELLILRFPTDRGDILKWLSDGPPWRLGDTLVHYRRNATDQIPLTTLKEGFRLREATAADIPRIRKLAESLFGTYTSHYQCNPRTNDPVKLAAGYAEWSVRFVSEPALHKFCYLVETADGAELAAYIGFELLDGSGHVTIGGVGPGYQQYGFYRQLVENGFLRFGKMGARWVEISTQVQNFAVQKVWTRLGLEIFKAEYTVHLDLRRSEP